MSEWDNYLFIVPCGKQGPILNIKTIFPRTMYWNFHDKINTVAN